MPGEEWMGTVRAGNNKVEIWRGAFRTAVHFALISQQSGQFVYVWIHAHHLTRYSTMFSARLSITIDYRRPFHEQLSCLANVHLNINNLHSSLGVVNCQISADFVVTVNIIYTLSKLVNSCRKSTRLE